MDILYKSMYHILGLQYAEKQFMYKCKGLLCSAMYKLDKTNDLIIDKV